MSCGQEVLIEELKVILALYISLNELQDVSTKCFHRLDHGVICTALNNGVAYLLAEHLIDIKQVRENVFEIKNVFFSNTLSYSLVNFDNVIKRLNDVEVQKTLRILTCSLKNHLPISIRKLKNSMNKVFFFLVRSRANHPSNSFVNLKSLMFLKILTILWNILNEIEDIRWLIILRSCKHVHCQFRNFQKCLGCHVLHSWVGLKHEFVQLLYNCL